MDQDLAQQMRAAAERAGLTLDAERLAALVEQAEAARQAAIRLAQTPVGDLGPAGGIPAGLARAD